MKVLHLILLLAVAAVAPGHAQQPFKVGTYNIRYAAAADVASGNGWETRKYPLADLIRRHRFDLIGTQESAHLWRDLHELLPDYACIAHPDRGKATFYRADLFLVVDTGLFWLSETPDVPSIGWDATDQRDCFWIKFQEKKTGREFFFFNTHFYYRLQVARRESGPVLVRKIREIAGDAPVICVGDFNSTAATPQIRAVKQLLRDAYDHAKTPRQGPEHTNMGGGVFQGTPKNRIDYVFVSPHFGVETYAVIADVYGGDRYPSDHLPVAARLSWPAGLVPAAPLATAPSAATAPTVFPADYNHIIGYGQSLSVGSIGRMYINATGLPQGNSWMFNNGLRYTPGETDSSMTHFVPLVEHDRGETASSGMADMLMQSLQADQQKAGFQLVFRTPGAGGKSVQHLRRNDQQPHYYESVLRGVRRGQQLAAQLGKTFNVPAFTWTQGEADIAGGMGRAAYKKELSQLYSELNADVRNITGQHNDVACIMYQTASHNRYYHVSTKKDKIRNPEIAIAQYELAVADNRFYMATPMYPFDYAMDNTHLNTEYSRLLGAYYGYVFKKVLVDGEDWRPVHPVKLVARKNKLQITMHVPVKPLTIDTDWVQAIANYGFNIYRGDTEIRIKKVRLTGPDELTIWTDRNLMEGDRITYAINGESTGRFTGSRGNIRDSQGDRVTYTIGCTTYRLHNWLPMFEERIHVAP